MKTTYSVDILLDNMDENKYKKLIDFLQENNYDYDEENYNIIEVDERNEDEKYQDWLDEQADIVYEERKINNE